MENFDLRLLPRVRLKSLILLILSNSLGVNRVKVLYSSTGVMDLDRLLKLLLTTFSLVIVCKFLLWRRLNFQESKQHSNSYPRKIVMPFSGECFLGDPVQMSTRRYLRYRWCFPVLCFLWTSSPCFSPFVGFPSAVFSWASSGVNVPTSEVFDLTILFGR